MHCSVLYLVKNQRIEHLSLCQVEDDFADAYCDGCGEHTPKYSWFCDWFVIGGRWADILEARRGISVETPGPKYGVETSVTGRYSVIDSRDMVGPIKGELFYAIATKSRIYTSEDEQFRKLLNKINENEFDGCLVVLDCHY